MGVMGIPTPHHCTGWHGDRAELNIKVVTIVTSWLGSRSMLALATIKKSDTISLHLLCHRRSLVRRMQDTVTFIEIPAVCIPILFGFA